MNKELFETMMSCAREMMQETQSRLRHNNQMLQEKREKCGELEIQFTEALDALAQVNSEMAEMFEEHHDAYESLGYQTEQFSYVQGFIDCMQLLSGMGAIRGINQEKIDQYLMAYSSQEKK